MVDVWIAWICFGIAGGLVAWAIAVEDRGTRR